MWTICNLAKTNLCKALAPVSMSMRFFIGKKKVLSMSVSLLTKLSNYKSCLSYEVLVFLVVRFLLFAPCFTRLLHSSACSSGDWATDRVTSYIMRDRHSLRPVVDSLHPKATVFLAPEKKRRLFRTVMIHYRANVTRPVCFMLLYFFEWVLTTFVLIVLRHGPVLRQHAST